MTVKAFMNNLLVENSEKSSGNKLSKRRNIIINVGIDLKMICSTFYIKFLEYKNQYAPLFVC